MTLNAVLLGAILVVIVGGGIVLCRLLVAIRKLLEEITGKLPSSPLLTKLLSFDSVRTLLWRPLIERIIRT